jgi:FixJ family two-component response regulator
MGVISVVDDDAEVRSATVDLLNSVGFCCEAYESAEDYLGAPQAMRTACLILDLNMPGLNGLELQQQLAQSGHSIPIIFITAFPEERTRAQAIGAGALSYLAKPCSDGELLECVRTALARRDRIIRPEDQGSAQ